MARGVKGSAVSTREGGMMLALRVFVPVDKKDLRSQITVTEACMKAVDGMGLDALLALPGLALVKVTEHPRYTTREKAAAAPAGGDVGDPSKSDEQAEHDEQRKADAGEFDGVGAPDTGEEQAAATEEHATGRRKAR